MKLEKPILLREELERLTAAALQSPLLERVREKVDLPPGVAKNGPEFCLAYLAVRVARAAQWMFEHDEEKQNGPATGGGL